MRAPARRSRGRSSFSPPHSFTRSPLQLHVPAGRKGKDPMRTQNIGSARVRYTPRLRPWSDWVHEAVDTIGLIPGLNIPAEIVSGALSLYKRDYIGFGLSVAGLVPVAGDLAVGVKIVRTASTVATAARVAKRVRRVARAVQTTHSAAATRQTAPAVARRTSAPAA